MTDINKTYLFKEVVFLVGRYLTVPQLAGFKQACKLFNAIGSDVKFLQPLYHRLCHLDETLPPLLSLVCATSEFKNAFEKVRNRQEKEIIFLNEHYTKAYRDLIERLLAIPSNTLEHLAKRNNLLNKLNSEIIQENIDRQPGTEFALTQSITRFIMTKANAEFFRKLTVLYCNSRNPLIVLKLDGCSALNWLYCENNKLTILSLQNCAALETLYCDNNPLTTLNLQGCTNLKKLYCDNNLLTTLNLQGCPGLKQVYCNNSRPLTTLNLQDCEALETLHCNNNGLTTLTLQGCAKLQRIYCCNNPLLAKLNLQNLGALEWLYCRKNPLTILNLEGTSQAFQVRHVLLFEEIKLRIKKLSEIAESKQQAEIALLENELASFSLFFSERNKKMHEPLQVKEQKDETKKESPENKKLKKD